MIMPIEQQRGIAMQQTTPQPPASYPPPPPNRTGMVAWKTNTEMDAEQAAKENSALANPDPVNGLSQYITKLFTEAAQAKIDIEQDLIKDLAQRKGEYTQEERSVIDTQREPLIYDNVTEVKASAANAWISDIIVFQPNDHPWALDPTPISDLPEEEIQSITIKVMRDFLQAQMAGQMPTNIQSLPPQQQQQIADMLAEYAGKLRGQVEEQIVEESKHRAKRMERKINDQLAEGGFEDAFDDFLEDFCTYRTAFLKGPIVRRIKKPTYTKDQNGKTFCVTSDEITYEYSSPSPFDIYPLKNATCTNDGYIERIKYSRSDVEAMMGTEGVNDAEIIKALQENQFAGYQTYQTPDSQRALLEDRRYTYTSEDTIEGLEAWVPVRGYMLNEWIGSPGQFEDYMDYEITAICIGKRVVKVIPNPDPHGNKPLYSASFRRSKGSFWGRSVPWLMRDKQRAINSCVRALCRNMGFASGPMAWVDPSALPAGVNSIEELHPLQLFQLVKKQDGSTGKPIDFFNVDSHAQELMGIRDKLAQECDDATGIPPYVYGNDKAAGAGRTMGGLSMLLTAASRGIKKAIANIDKGIIKPLIKRQWTMNMLYEKDESIKGDVNVIARGALALFVKEQSALRRMEILQTTANPIDMQIIGLTGRAELWREMFKSVNLPTEDIIPSAEEMDRRLQAMAQQQLAAQNQQKKLAPPNKMGSGSNQDGADAQPVGQTAEGAQK